MYNNIDDMVNFIWASVEDAYDEWDDDMDEDAEDEDDDEDFDE